MTQNEWIAARQTALCEDLCALIRIKSVQEPPAQNAPFGAGVNACLDAALALGERLGLRCGRMDGWAGWCEWGDGEEMTAVLAHLDVVPEGDGWSLPPYAGVIRDGRVYGRGAMDDKGPAVAALYALAALAQTGVPLRRRVRVLLGTNEESGAAGIRYYCEHGGEMPVLGFTPDGEYPVINGEKGIANLAFTASLPATGSVFIEELCAGEAPNIVPAVAKAQLCCPPQTAQKICQMRAPGITCTKTATGVLVQAAGNSAHGASPWEGHNAAGLLCGFLAGLEEISERKPISFLARQLGTQWDAAALGAAYRDEISGPLTCNLGMLRLENGLLTARCNLRVPVTANGEALLSRVEQAFAAAGFALAERSYRPGFYLPETHPLVAALAGVFAQETGIDAAAKCIGGGTYAKAMPNVVAFGPVFPGDEVREHKPDEFIEIKRLLQNCRMMASAMQRLANLTPLSEERKEF